MKIINQTNWRTDHLREFVKLFVVNKLADSYKRRPFELVFHHASGALQAVSIAHIRTNRVVTFLPQAELRGDDLAGAMEVAVRCLKLGFGEKNTYGGNIRPRRHKDELTMLLPLEHKPPRHSRAKPKPTKLDIAKAALAKWESKRKRCETAIRKYKKRVLYYERRVAACK